ncbi:MAG: hypothetical protein Fur006_16670 [Coleofasciculaceae cyanobacterium]
MAETKAQSKNALRGNFLTHKVSTLLGLIGLSTAAFCVSFVFFNQAAKAQLVRPNPWTVILSDWQGTWNCNLDGRLAVLKLQLLEKRVFVDFVGSTYSELFVSGQFSDSGGAWKHVTQRSFNSGDLASSRRDHMLPLIYENRDNWMLIMHAGNRNYISGYTTWNGSVFGMQCRRR